MSLISTLNKYFIPDLSNIILSYNEFSNILLHTLIGHIQPIFYIAILPNDDLVSASTLGEIKIWSSRDNYACICTFYTGCDYDKFHKRLTCITTLIDNTIVVAGKGIPIMKFSLNRLGCVNMTSSENIRSIKELSTEYIITGSDDNGILKIWRKNLIEKTHFDTEHSRVLNIIKFTSSSSISSISSISSSEIITCHDNGIVIIWSIDVDNSSLVLKYILKDNRDAIWDVVVLSNNNIVTTGENCTVKIWMLDKDKYKCIQRLEKHHDLIYSVAILQDETLVTNSIDTTIVVWSHKNYDYKYKNTIELKRQITPHGNYSMVVNNDKIIVCYNCEIYIYC